MPTHISTAATGARAAPRLRLIARLQRLDAAYRERRRIEELSPEILRDIGLTEDDRAQLLGCDGGPRTRLFAAARRLLSS